MGEELEMTLDGLRHLHGDGRRGRWRMRLYDYAQNRWLDADEAFSRQGLYEAAVLTDPYGRGVLVRVVPEGRSSLSVDAASAGEPGVWRAMGVRMVGGELALVRALLEGREGTVPLRELDATLADVEARGGGDAPCAAAARKALRPLLEGRPGEDVGRGAHAPATRRRARHRRGGGG